MLLLQLASMNAFYSMWQPEDITFHESLSLPWDFFKRHVAAFFEDRLKEVGILCVISTIAIPKFQDKTDYAS